MQSSFLEKLKSREYSGVDYLSMLHGGTITSAIEYEMERYLNEHQRKIGALEKAIKNGKPILLFLYGFNRLLRERFIQEHSELLTLADQQYIYAEQDVEETIISRFSDEYHIVSIMDLRGQVATQYDMVDFIHKRDPLMDDEGAYISIGSNEERDKKLLASIIGFYQGIFPARRKYLNSPRIHVSDEHWKEAIGYFIDMASKIVVFYQEPSDGVLYELKLLKKRSRSSDVMVVTSLYFRHSIGRLHGIDLALWLGGTERVVDYFHFLKCIGTVSLRRDLNEVVDDGTFTGKGVVDSAEEHARRMVTDWVRSNSAAAGESIYCIEVGKLFEAEGNYVAALFWFLLASDRTYSDSASPDMPCCLSSLFASAVSIAGLYYHKLGNFNRAISCYDELYRLFSCPEFEAILLRDLANTEKQKVAKMVSPGWLDLADLRSRAQRRMPPRDS